MPYEEKEVIEAYFTKRLFWKTRALDSNTYDLDIHPHDLENGSLFEDKIKKLMVAFPFSEGTCKDWNNIWLWTYFENSESRS